MKIERYDYAKEKKLITPHLDYISLSIYSDRNEHLTIRFTIGGC